MGYIFALTAVFLWSINIVIASYFASALTPLELAFGRWLVAFIILLFIIRRIPASHIAILRKHWKLLFCLGLSGIALDNTLIYVAGHTASAIDMGMLSVTGPLFLAILSWIFLRAPIKFSQVIGLLFAIIGVLTVVTNGDLLRIGQIKMVSGNFWMLFNCLMFAVYSILQTRRPKEITQPEFLAASVLFGLVILFFPLLIETPLSSILNFGWQDYAVILYLGIFNSVIAFLSWNTAIAKIGSIKTSIIYYLLPLFSGLGAYIFLGEKLQIADAVGGALIILGVLIVTFDKHPQKIQ